MISTVTYCGRTIPVETSTPLPSKMKRRFSKALARGDMKPETVRRLINLFHVHKTYNLLKISFFASLYGMGLEKIENQLADHVVMHGNGITGKITVIDEVTNVRTTPTGRLVDDRSYWYQRSIEALRDMKKSMIDARRGTTNVQRLPIKTDPIQIPTYINFDYSGVEFRLLAHYAMNQKKN